MRKLTLPPKDVRTIEDASRAITQLHETLDFIERVRWKSAYEVLRPMDVVELLPMSGYSQYLYRLNLDRDLKISLLQVPAVGCRLVFLIKDDGAGRTVSFSSNLIPSDAITLSAGETRVVEFVMFGEA